MYVVKILLVELIDGGMEENAMQKQKTVLRLFRAGKRQDLYRSSKVDWVSCIWG
jgi:hypothetical protein